MSFIANDNADYRSIDRSPILAKTQKRTIIALIVRSMANRYANFVREGDQVRGDVMKMLLVKARVDVAALGDKRATMIPRPFHKPQINRAAVNCND